jgi:hypothetical protein
MLKLRLGCFWDRGLPPYNETKMRKNSKLLRVAIESLLMLGFVISGSIPGSARDRNETIDATAFCTGTQLGANIGVTLNIYESSVQPRRRYKNSAGACMSGAIYGMCGTAKAELIRYRR